MQLTVDQQPVAAASVPDPFPQWDYYPTHVEQHDPFLVQAEQLRDRTLTLSKSLFSPSKTNVRLIDIDTHADGMFRLQSEENILTNLLRVSKLLHEGLSVV